MCQSREPKSRQRREFIEVLGKSVLLLPVLVACGSNLDSQGGKSTGTIEVGKKPAQLAVGSLSIVPNEPLAIGRDTQGIYAMTLICPHADCDMSTAGTVDGNGVFCNCHGSRFDPNGAVQRGPASQALAHYAVSVDQAGSLVIDAGQVVDASQRLAV